MVHHNDHTGELARLQPALFEEENSKYPTEVMILALFALVILILESECLPDRRGWFESCRNRKSATVPIKEGRVRSKLQCVNECLGNPLCHSANYFNSQTGRRCVHFGEDLSLQQCGTHVYDAQTTLIKMLNPCQNGFSFDRQKCLCGPGYGGEFCEHPPLVTELEYHVQSYKEDLTIKNQRSMLTRGFHVYIYDEYTADWTGKRYDTLGYIGLEPAIMAYIDAVPTGKLLMFATSDDATMNMDQSLRDYMSTNYNSVDINSLLYRGAWILVGVKGGQKLLERLYNAKPPAAFPAATSIRFRLVTGNSQYFLYVL